MGGFCLPLRKTQGGSDSTGTYVTTFGQVVFPNAKDAPTTCSQGSIDKAVAGFVGSKFLFPKGSITRGNLAMPVTSVPEAAIHEDG